MKRLVATWRRFSVGREADAACRVEDLLQRIA